MLPKITDWLSSRVRVFSCQSRLERRDPAASSRQETARLRPVLSGGTHFFFDVQGYFE